MRDVRRGMDTQVHLVRLERAVRRELQHRFLVVEIPHVPHRFGNSFALRVHGLGVELLPGFDQTVFAAGNLPNRLVFRYIHLVRTNRVGLVRRDEIGDVHLAVLDGLDRVHRSLKISHVIHLLAQLLHARTRLLFVVDNRRLTHLKCIPLQGLFGLGSGVYWGGVVDMQLQFPKTEDLCVLPLTQVVAQVRSGHRRVIYTLDVRLVQQTLVLRHEFRRVAGTKQHRDKQYEDLIPHI